MFLKKVKKFFRFFGYSRNVKLSLLAFYAVEKAKEKSSISEFSKELGTKDSQRSAVKSLVSIAEVFDSEGKSLDDVGIEKDRFVAAVKFAADCDMNLCLARAGNLKSAVREEQKNLLVSAQFFHRFIGETDILDFFLNELFERSDRAVKAAQD